MGTLIASTFKSLTALTPPLVKDVNGVAIGHFCTAWVNFNGTGTVAIRDSFNISSITDNGTGTYTVNFTNAMANNNYSMSSGSGFGGNTFGSPGDSITEYTVNGFKFYNRDANNGAVDSALVCIQVFGGR